LGDGEEHDKLVQLAGKSERIIFAGAVSPAKVQEYIKNSDILVMNSTFEGIPMIILEAVSWGMPVITTNAGGIGEVLTYGSDSEVTDGTVVQIEQAMDKICEEYIAYSKHAYEKSLKYDYRKVNCKIFEVLNQNLKWEGKQNDSE
jgi:glycosyltransferase involved in cell wall biosynthesis